MRTARNRSAIDWHPKNGRRACRDAEAWAGRFSIAGHCRGLVDTGRLGQGSGSPTASFPLDRSPVMFAVDQGYCDSSDPPAVLPLRPLVSSADGNGIDLGCCQPSPNRGWDRHPSLIDDRRIGRHRPAFFSMDGRHQRRYASLGRVFSGSGRPRQQTRCAETAGSHAQAQAHNHPPVTVIWSTASPMFHRRGDRFRKVLAITRSAHRLVASFEQRLRL